jgi:hypothetical protein
VKAVLMDPATTKTVVALGGEGTGIEVVDATCEILTAAGFPLKILTPPHGVDALR